MSDNIDNIIIGDLYTADYLKNRGLINSPSFNRLYTTKYRADLNPTSPDVVNDGVDDISNVFEIQDVSCSRS